MTALPDPIAILTSEADGMRKALLELESGMVNLASQKATLNLMLQAFENEISRLSKAELQLELDLGD